MAQSESIRVAVLGASGYVGGELLRLLAGHPGVGELRGYSASAAGQAWSDVHPSLLHVAPATFLPPDIAAVARWADVVFLALPHGTAQTLIGELSSTAATIIDTSADFRIHDQGRYEAAYGAHRAWGRVGDFVYGLADVLGASLAGQRRIAVPGCFATAALLALYPFAVTGTLGGQPTAFAVTGSTGAGSEPRRTTHHPVRAHNFFAYAVTGHRHEAEVADQLVGWTRGGAGRCDLLVHAAPLVRGISATVIVPLDGGAGDPLETARTAYAGRSFVRVLETPPELAPVVGTNFAHLSAALRPGTGEAVVTVAIDNLVKGAAGQAVQAMNLAIGLDEAAGLAAAGIFPC